MTKKKPRSGKAVKPARRNLRRNRQARAKEHSPAAQAAVSRLFSGIRIPPILLEGDDPTLPPTTGPGMKYAVGAAPATAKPEQRQALLPEAYGTGRLRLLARDPHWLYAHWDLSAQQQRHYNTLSADRHLVLRIQSHPAGVPVANDVHVHPESQHWFVQVAEAGARYTADLGYYDSRRRWTTIASSPPATTPPEKASMNQAMTFATIPAELHLTQVQPLHARPGSSAPPPPEPVREHRLTELARISRACQDETTSPEAEPSSIGAGPGETVPELGEFFAAAEAGVEHISSPMGAAAAGPPAFWMSVNAEVVVYGATAPEACLSVGGRPVLLRPDGSFSCRMALPDGEHAVTVSAISPAGDLRQAELRFTRRTARYGEVFETSPETSRGLPTLEPSPDPGL